MGVDPDLFAIYGAEKPLFTRSFRPASPNPRFSVHNIAPLSVQIARYNASPTRERACAGRQSWPPYSKQKEIANNFHAGINQPCFHTAGCGVRFQTTERCNRYSTG